MSIWRAREAKTAETYGCARWASTREVLQEQLLGKDGVALGKLGRDYLRHDGPELILYFAPTPPPPTPRRWQQASISQPSVPLHHRGRYAALAAGDVRQVFIEFPRGTAIGEMPPLFVIGRWAAPWSWLIFRVQGNHNTVNRRFAAAELRFGSIRT